MVVTEQEARGELPMLGFERLTYVPFDIRLIDRSLLSPAEFRWINEYHAGGLPPPEPAAGGRGSRLAGAGDQPPLMTQGPAGPVSLSGMPQMPLASTPRPFYPVPPFGCPWQQRPDERSPDALVPVLRLATHTDMHAIWQIDADVFGEDVYPGFFFRQAMDLWPELLVVAERKTGCWAMPWGGWSGSVAGLAALPRGTPRKRAASAWPSK